jgi:hypothetical protein
MKTPCPWVAPSYGTTNINKNGGRRNKNKNKDAAFKISHYRKNFQVVFTLQKENKILKCFSSSVDSS